MFQENVFFILSKLWNKEHPWLAQVFPYHLYTHLLLLLNISDTSRAILGNASCMWRLHPHVVAHIPRMGIFVSWNSSWSVDIFNLYIIVIEQACGCWARWLTPWRRVVPMHCLRNRPVLPGRDGLDCAMAVFIAACHVCAPEMQANAPLFREVS